MLPQPFIIGSGPGNQKYSLHNNNNHLHDVLVDNGAAKSYLPTVLNVPECLDIPRFTEPFPSPVEICYLPRMSRKVAFILVFLM